MHVVGNDSFDTSCSTLQMEFIIRKQLSRYNISGKPATLLPWHTVITNNVQQL